MHYPGHHPPINCYIFSPLFMLINAFIAYSTGHLFFFFHSSFFHRPYPFGPLPYPSNAFLIILVIPSRPQPSPSAMAACQVANPFIGSSSPPGERDSGCREPCEGLAGLGPPGSNLSFLSETVSRLEPHPAPALPLVFHTEENRSRKRCFSYASKWNIPSSPTLTPSSPLLSTQAYNNTFYGTQNLVSL